MTDGSMKLPSSQLSPPWSPEPSSRSAEPPARRLAGGKFVTTATLSSRTCKWPIGDPSEADFHYCGHAPQSGRPYCDAHDRKSYQPVARKRA